MAIEKPSKRRVGPKRELSVFDEMLEPFKPEEWVGDLTPSMKQVAESKRAVDKESEQSHVKGTQRSDSVKVTLNERLAVFETQDDQPLPAFLEKLKAAPAEASETGSKQVANGYQTGSKRVAADQAPENKRVAERVAERVANGYQTGSKRVAADVLRTLVGKERDLLLFVVNECRLCGELVTPPLTLERLSEVLDCRSNRAKNVINRLADKDLISRAEAKPGRGGWSRFGISRELLQAVILCESDSKRVANGYQTGSKQVAKRVAERVAEPPVVVVSLGSEASKNYNYSEIDLPASLLRLGLTKQSLVDSALTPTEMQASLDDFAYDLDAGILRPRKGPLALLIGTVKKKPYVSEYRRSKHQKQEHQERHMAQVASENHEVDQIDLEQMLAFDEWLRTATPDEQSRLIQPTESAPAGSMIYRNALKAKFLETPNGALKSS
jgi:hypothetical protein